MLLTNTINAQTINSTVVNDNVICGVALRGCSACPAHFADRPSGKRAAQRISERFMRLAARGMHAMYFGNHLSWQQLWLDSPASQQTASGLLLGLVSGRSLS